MEAVLPESGGGGEGAQEEPALTGRNCNGEERETDSENGFRDGQAEGKAEIEKPSNRGGARDPE